MTNESKKKIVIKKGVKIKEHKMPTPRPVKKGHTETKKIIIADDDTEYSGPKITKK